MKKNFKIIAKDWMNQSGRKVVKYVVYLDGLPSGEFSSQEEAEKFVQEKLK